MIQVRCTCTKINESGVTEHLKVGISLSISNIHYKIEKGYPETAAAVRSTTNNNAYRSYENFKLLFRQCCWIHRDCILHNLCVNRSSLLH